jgi:hypothetical protein
MTADLAIVVPLPILSVNVLKWILLAVAIGTFAIPGWAAVLADDRSPPQPDSFADKSGATLMTGADSVDGKAGFRKAGLMDYGCSTAWQHGFLRPGCAKVAGCRPGSAVRMRLSRADANVRSACS